LKTVQRVQLWWLHHSYYGHKSTS